VEGWAVSQTRRPTATNTRAVKPKGPILQLVGQAGRVFVKTVSKLEKIEAIFGKVSAKEFAGAEEEK
jgi:hypothetical protein